MNELALFAGAGGGILGGVLLGWRTVCAVERDPFCARRLMQRQNEGHLPPFPIWDDVRTFDGRPWRGVVDVVSGGFPCQDISAAGKGEGIEGERSGLWREMARIVGEVRPSFVYVENSPLLVGRGLVRVLADLAEMGFDAGWGVVGASDVGAPHKRERFWGLANAAGARLPEGLRRSRGALRDEARGPEPERLGCDVADTHGDARDEGRSGDAEEGPGGRNAHRGGEREDVPDADGHEYQGEPHAGLGQGQGSGAALLRGDWPVEPELGRVAHGVAHRVDRLRAIGNGQVPRVAATAFMLLAQGL